MCLSKRRDRVRSFAKSIIDSDEGTFCALPFTALLEIPEVKDLINSSGIDQRADELDLEGLRETIIEHGLEAKREARERCEPAMEEALIIHGLLPARSHGKTNKRRKDKSFGSSVNVLEHNCAFFRNLLRDRDPMSFESTGCAQVKHSYRFTDLMAIPTGPEAYDYRSNVPDAQAMMIAKILADVLDIGELTMKELDALGKTFVCLRCDPLLRQKLTWQELVSGGCITALLGVDITCYRLVTISVKKRTIKRQNRLVYGP